MPKIEHYTRLKGVNVKSLEKFSSLIEENDKMKITYTKTFINGQYYFGMIINDTRFSTIAEGLAYLAKSGREIK